MKKIVAALMCLTILSSVKVFASIDTVIKNSAINKNSIVAVSVKNAKNGKSIFQQNHDKLLVPASMLKIFTTKSAIDTLGKDFTFNTSVYQDGQNNLYIKLSGDPMLTEKTLRDVLKKANVTDSQLKVQTVYIDDSSLDSYNWGIGWMWDDDTNYHMPKFGAYNLNGNLIDIVVSPEPNGTISIQQDSDYKVSIINLLELGPTNNIIPVRQNNIIYLTGTISSRETIQLPIDNLQRYFVLKLQKALKSAGIAYETISYAQVPSDAEILSEYKQELTPIVYGIFRESNNLMAETLFKTAGGKYSAERGSISNAIKMFNSYYEEKNLAPEQVSVVDGSGISRNNLVSVGWMTDALVNFSSEEGFSEFKKYFEIPDSGILFERFASYEGNVYAKMGSLSGISGLIGYIKTKNNNDIAFCINIQNYKGNAQQAAKLEEEIVSEIYNNY